MTESAQASPLMRAGVATEHGLQVREVPRPIPTDEQVLVRVEAAGINRADLNAAKGAGISSNSALGKPIGMEWAGRIVEAGREVKNFKEGDRVMCFGSGGYAEYAVADAGRTLRLDTAMEMEQSAILPVALLTAHDAVITNGRLAGGESILVQGASSAVGLAALRIAMLKGAGLVIGASTNPERRKCLSEFGAGLVIDPGQSNWPDQVLEATGGKGANVIVDMVSGDGFNSLMRAASVRGRVVNVGRLGGVTAAFDFDLHAAKRLDYIGTTFRTRSLQEVRALVQKMREDLWDWIVSGALRLPIDKRFALEEAPAAHDRMSRNAHFGKIVLDLSGQIPSSVSRGTREE